MSSPPDLAGTSRPLRGRLAPSPTGLLHLGHARTFVLAWWHLRSRGGEVLLRIEDLDTGRVRPEFEETLLEDLAWLGLDWDGEVERQSQHRERFEEALARLAATGLVYPCVCTRKELELASSAPHVEDGTRPYPGTCRDRFASLEQARRKSGREPALRFRCPEGDVLVQDALFGATSEDPSMIFGDFPVLRRDRAPAYQLAVVVDDAHQAITEVHRGDDLLTSACAQVRLARALGTPEPRWIHFPLVLDESGQRLAKRHDSLALRELRQRGVSARAVLAWIASSAGQDPALAEGSREALTRFDLQRVPRTPVTWRASDLEP